MAEKDKKRKRVSNGVDTPNKKVAFQPANSARIQVEHIENRSYPVLVSAPGLRAPAVEFTAYTKPVSSKTSSDALPTPKTHDVFFYYYSDTSVYYTASPITLDRHLSHYVGVFDPSTNRLQVTPAHHLSLRSTLRLKDEEIEKEKQKRTIGQQREELGREFGTKKAKKAIADKTVNAIVRDPKGKGKKDNVQDAILDAMPQSAAGTKNKAEQLEETLSVKPIPKPNLSADNVEDVYAFDILVPPNDARQISVKELREKAEALGESETPDFKHSYTDDRLRRIVQTEDVHRLKALSYLTLLLDFHNALQPAGRSGKKVPKKDTFQRKLSSWPEGLVASVSKRFSNPTFEMPKWYMENLYTHICCLSLFIDGWTSNMKCLKNDLRMETRELTQYFRELGANVTAVSEAERERANMKQEEARATRMAKLRLPLDFPKMRSARRR